MDINVKCVLGGRLELPRVAPLVPKTSAYTNSAIPAMSAQRGSAITSPGDFPILKIRKILSIPLAQAKQFA